MRQIFLEIWQQKAVLPQAILLWWKSLMRNSPGTAASLAAHIMLLIILIGGFSVLMPHMERDEQSASIGVTLIASAPEPKKEEPKIAAPAPSLPVAKPEERVQPPSPAPSVPARKPSVKPEKPKEEAPKAKPQPKPKPEERKPVAKEPKPVQPPVRQEEKPTPPPKPNIEENPEVKPDDTPEPKEKPKEQEIEERPEPEQEPVRPPVKPVEEPEEKPDPIKPEPAEPEPLTISQTQLLHERLYGCWYLPAGVESDDRVSEFSVTVEFSLLRNGEIESISTGNYSHDMDDALYSAFVASAVQAVKRCSPVDYLPQEKYIYWRQIKMRFSPQKW